MMRKKTGYELVINFNAVVKYSSELQQWRHL